MAHEIEFDAIRKINPMAFVGDTPWHGLGQQLSPDQPLEVWAQQAGMDWEIKRTPALGLDYQNDEVFPFPSKQILYRGDSLAPLSIVSDKYNIVQPQEVLEFYRELISAGGFKMNTAGVLFGGKKFWALAELGKSALIAGHDRVDGFLLLATSCDGSLATTAQFTSIRVVCNNTLTFAVDGKAGKNAIKVPHSLTFDPELVKAELGVASQSFDKFIDQANALTQRRVSDKEAVEFLVRVVNNLKDDDEVDEEAIETSDARSVKAIFELYTGGGMGSQMKSASHTAWGLVNAVTEFVDHKRNTRTTDSRLNGAWFGAQANLKDRALIEALKLAA
jgi:phage/plasmid-like protein (TIGR03299 family)